MVPRSSRLVRKVDNPKKPTSEAIRLLHADGILIIVLNGDDRTTAEAVTRKPGLDCVDAEALPEKT